MSKSKTTNVEYLIQHFIELWKEGNTILEISKICKVSPSTGYNKLQLIADMNGFRREQLLGRYVSDSNGSDDIEALIKSSDVVIANANRNLRDANKFITESKKLLGGEYNERRNTVSKNRSNMD